MNISHNHAHNQGKVASKKYSVFGFQQLHFKFGTRKYAFYQVQTRAQKIVIFKMEFQGSHVRPNSKSQTTPNILV
jgi:hypothetical protein